MGLELRQLRVFLAVVDTGSLGRAAEALYLTEPAVSRIVKRLEQRLQVPLFERRTTGMELTSFGHALLPHAHLLVSGSGQAVEEIDALRGLHRGTLRIGAVASAMVMILPPVIERILARWPGVHVQIIEAVEDKLAEALAGNAIDIVVSGAIAESEQIVQLSEHTFTDRYSVITAAHHPLQGRQEIPVGELQGLQWVMPPAEAEPRRLFNGLFAKLGLPTPPVGVETRSPGAIKAIVARTLFLGWLPEPLFAAERAAGLIMPLPVRELAILRHFFVYRRRRSFTPPLLQVFLEELKRVDLPQPHVTDATATTRGFR